MKMRVYLVILLCVFTACLPANGEILIYNLARIEGRTFIRVNEGFTSYVTEDKEAGRGYLILDMDFVRDYSIDNAMLITYSSGETKTYYGSIHDFVYQSFWSGGEWPGDSGYWVLSDINTPKEGETASMILSGEPGKRNIGLPN